MKVLVLNSGSSSQKVCLFDLAEILPDDPPGCLWDAKIEWDGESAAIAIKNSDGEVQRAQVPISSRGEALKHLLGNLWNGRERLLSQPTDIDLVGHRVVHGGPEYEEPMFITPEVRARIAGASAFAPLHKRAEVEGMETVERLLGPVPQVGVCDTGFHRKMPLPAVVYPGPYEWFSGGIRRYGFHGINHQYCAERAAKLLRKSLTSLKLVTCHLGNGCSLAAIREGHSVDTTMGFTPLEGLMMGTRSGSIDPGILTYLMRQGSFTAEQLDELLNKKSGLLGISGVSGDMRQIVAAMKEGNSRAKLAFNIFVHRLRSSVGAMIAGLGGIHALIFTAGIGENSPEIRAASCENFGFLGVKLDPAKNAQSLPDQDISLSDSVVRVLVVRT